LSSDFRRTLRRLKPNKHRAQLKPRTKSELKFIETSTQRPAKLLYDTTVYIDILQGRFPQQGEAMLRATEAWHSPVTEAELAAACEVLDPVHSQTRQITEQVVAVINRRPPYRTITPDSEIWWEAGILSGILARVQGYGNEQRRRVLNDALLFASGRKYGCTVLTRNIRDFDLLEQLDPSGRVLFYRLNNRGTKGTALVKAVKAQPLAAAPENW
jgi:predicted nucleic acid-binding protein